MRTIATHWLVLILFSIVMFGYFSFALNHLGKFQTADEDLWYADPTEGRIHTYWRAIENKEWMQTRINDKPGVTTAILGYWGYKADKYPYKKMLEDGNIVDRFDPKVYEYTAYHYQLPFVVANGILLILLFSLAWKYTESGIFALIFGGLTALSPILIGVSQIVNPDATTWSFGAVALFAYLIFLKTAHFRWLWLAAPLFGFALLSKYGTSFLLFFTFFLTFVHPFFYKETFPNAEKYAKTMFRLLLGWILFVVGAIVIFALCMPAAIFNPSYIYEGTIGFRHAKDIRPLLWAMGTIFGIFLFEIVLFRGKIFFRTIKSVQCLRQPILILFSIFFLFVALLTLYNWNQHNRFAFEDVPFDTGTGKAFSKLDFRWKPFLEIKSLVFTLQPIVLIPALFAFAFCIWKKHRHTFLLFVCATYAVFFYIAILLQNILVHVRYSVLLYPIMTCAAAISITLVLERFVKNRIFQYMIIFIVLVLSAIGTRASLPYPFNYTNNFLPSQQNVTGAWGQGGYEAAQYLNSLPDAYNLVIWSDYEGVCPFFKGRCIKGSVIKWYNKRQLSGFDYIVMSRRGTMQNESTWKKLSAENKFYSDPVWELFIGGRERNFIRVYKMKKAYDSSTVE